MRDSARPWWILVAMTGTLSAWLLAQGGDIVPIPGARSEKRLAENVGAADVELSAEDLDRIQEIVPRAHAAAATPRR